MGLAQLSEHAHSLRHGGLIKACTQFKVWVLIETCTPFEVLALIWTCTPWAICWQIKYAEPDVFIHKIF